MVVVVGEGGYWPNNQLLSFFPAPIYLYHSTFFETRLTSYVLFKQNENKAAGCPFFSESESAQ